jgi:hypothetical protein
MAKLKDTPLQGTQKDGVSNYEALLTDDDEDEEEEDLSQESMDEGNENDQKKRNDLEVKGRTVLVLTPTIINLLIQPIVMVAGEILETIMEWSSESEVEGEGSHGEKSQNQSEDDKASSTEEGNG